MSIDKSKVKIGSDFEMFLVTSDGKFISAIPFNKGTKAHPEELDRKGCCIQRDGVLQECNVPPVSLNDSKLFIENVEFVKDFIRKNICDPKDLRLVCCASGSFEEDQLTELEAITFGCDPDFNAWKNGEVNPKPEGESTGLRSCGGHIHFSYPDADVDVSIELMKLFDLFLTVPYLLIDTDSDRRKLYGKAGAFRLQNWGNEAGFEARTLSNVWLETPELIKFTFEQLNAMFDYFNEHGTASTNDDGDIIIQAINDNRLDLAESLCKKYGIDVPASLMLEIV